MSVPGKLDAILLDYEELNSPASPLILQTELKHFLTISKFNNKDRL